MDSSLTLSNLFKQFQSFNHIIPAAYLKSATLNNYKKISIDIFPLYHYYKTLL